MPCVLSAPSGQVVNTSQATISRRSTRTIAKAVIRCDASRNTRSADGTHRLSRRASGAALLMAFSPLAIRQDAVAKGLESPEFVDIPQRAQAELLAIQSRQRQAIEEADATFENSELLATLKARSEANKAANAKELSTKYCMRQAELGIGDCGGLRFIPGATKNGKQKTPKWLQDALGVDLGEQKDPEIKF